MLRRPVPPAGLLRALARRRLVLAALAAAGAVAAAITALAPAPAPTVGVVVAARDLPAGRALSAGDVARVRLPLGAAPDGVVRDLEQARGEVLAGPARRGEPLTDVRLVGESLLEGYGEGMVAASVRVADPGSLALVRPGDLVDLHAATAGDGSTAQVRTAASGVRVVAVPPAEDALDAGGLLVVAARPAVAAELAGASATARLSVVLRGG